MFCIVISCMYFILTSFDISHSRIKKQPSLLAYEYSRVPLSANHSEHPILFYGVRRTSCPVHCALLLSKPELESVTLS